MVGTPDAADIEWAKEWAKAHLEATRGVTWWGTPDGKLHTAIVAETWFDPDADGEPTVRRERRFDPPICGACETAWPCPIFREATNATARR